ncbi:MAG: PfkB family carbohydrate kinase [Aggregatilineales bacterium]|nr:ribokinase [Chloroflexota bacterium]HOA25703.1 PfkB family carbohydrate kinase [Aggregatilineales bacterium]HQE19659.1 PfkB family carbohydrate kinase [Aggregatilineales bacterium]
MGEIDYLAIGHISKDLTPDGFRAGGTVTFAALTARALGLRVGVVTSLPRDAGALLSPLSDLPVVCRSAGAATTFENIYTDAGRQQVLSARAERLTLDDIPTGWRAASIVHLAPVAQEVDPGLAAHFRGACLCVTPQGWMRQWDGEGRVAYQPWESARDVLPYARAVVISIEDVRGDEDAARAVASRAQVGVVTRGAGGCTVFLNGEPHHVPAPAVEEVDPTGAGDIFATTFFIELCATGDALRAARFATLLASDSVSRSGLDAIPTADIIHRAREMV